MNDDGALATRLREGLERVRSPQPDLDAVRERARRVRVKRIAAGGVSAVLIGLAVGLPLALLAPLGHHRAPAPVASASESPDAVPEGFLGYLAPTFAEASGWNTQSTGPIGIDSEILPLTWAANVPFDRRDVDYATDNGLDQNILLFVPRYTVEGMSEEGVVVVASLFQGAAEGHNPNFPDRTLPLSLSDFERRDSWEGQISPNVPEWVSWVRVKGQLLDVRIYFATLHPSEATQAAAQEELARLQVPELPPIPPATTDLYPSGRHGWVTHVDRADHVSVSTSGGWTFRTNPVPNLIDPPILFAAGTWPFPTGGECAPDKAVTELGETQAGDYNALFWVSEYGPERVRNPADFPSRDQLGDRLGLGQLQGPLECVGEKAYVVQFEEAGRFFVVDAVLSPNATGSQRETLIDEISSIQAGDGVNCGVIDVGGPDYSWIFSLDHGAPGTEVTVSGPTLRGEDGRFASADRVEVWWGSGADALRVGSTDVTDRCAFVAPFQVPDVGAGTYPIEVRVYRESGYDVLATTDFTVP